MRFYLFDFKHTVVKILRVHAVRKGEMELSEPPARKKLPCPTIGGKVWLQSGP